MRRRTRNLAQSKPMPQNELVILGAFMSQRDAKQYQQHKSFQEGKVIGFSQQSKIRHRHASSRPVTIIATLLQQCENRHIDIRSHNQGGTVQRDGGVAGCRTWSDHVRKANQPNETAIAHAVSYTTSIFLRLHTTLTVLRLSSQQVLIKSFVVRCQQQNVSQLTE